MQDFGPVSSAVGAAVTPAGASDAQGYSLKLETASGSLLHKLANSDSLRGTGQGPSPTKIYLLVIAVTFLPLAAAALLSPLPIAASPALRLPFLYDWNVAFMFLVSFPCLMVLTLTDQQALTVSLRRVQLDGTLVVSPPESAALAGRWRARFRRINIAAQVTGIVAGSAVVYLNYVTYTPPAVGFWIARDGQLLPVGYGFLWCIFAFYALIPVYVFRSVSISLFLRDLVAQTQIRMLPFHPDHCGGLRPVGSLGLRNQYALTVFGVNVVLLVVVSIHYLQVPSSLYGLIMAAAVAYLALGPVVFMGPLLPFRAGMLRTKTELLGAVAQRLRVELQRLQVQLQSGLITKEDEALIDRLRKVGAVIDELPVWPFDAGTLRKFSTAYILPMLGALGSPFVTGFFDYLRRELVP